MRNSVIKMIRNLIVVTIGVCSLISTWLPNFTVLGHQVSSWLTTGTIVGLIYVYLTNNSNLFFLYWRKFCTWLINDTVGWSFKYQADGYSEHDLVNLRKNVKAILRSSGRIKSIQSSVNSTIETIVFNTNGGLETKYTITWDERDQDKFFVTLGQNAQSGYRTLNSFWGQFEQLKGKSFRNIAEQNDSELEKYDNHSSYHLRLKLEKNPFYRLTLRSYDKPTNLDFRLNFKENEASITVSNNELVVTSPDKLDVKKILKNYITLSRVY